MIERRAVVQAIADARGKTGTLRSFGAAAAAEAIDALLDTLLACPEMRELITEHDEKGAVLLSGKPAGYFRNRFSGWCERGLARRGARGQRFYAEVVIPKPEHLADVLTDAERTAAGDQAA